MAYFLSCPTCAFQQVVSELDDGISLKEQHESAYGGPHTVEFEVVEEQPLFRGGVSDDW